MRQLSTRDQVTQELTTIGYRTVFNNEQSSYGIVSYKRPQNDKCKQFKRKSIPILQILKILYRIPFGPACIHLPTCLKLHDVCIIFFNMYMYCLALFHYVNSA